MKTFANMLDSVLEWLGLARRARLEPRPSPQQLRTALTEMLADPKIRKLVFQELIAPVFPIQGGACTIPPSDISAGAFSCPGTWAFTGGKVGIGTPSPWRSIAGQCQK